MKQNKIPLMVAVSIICQFVSEGVKCLVSLVEINNLSKSFGNGNQRIQLFQDVKISINKNELIALRGRSGSGKTTLLNLIGTLDQPTSGTIHIDHQEITQLNDKQRTALRKDTIGFVFQSYGLFPLLSIEENIEFGLRLAGIPSLERKKKIKEAIELVGLSKRLHHRPYELSGGEQQRVAIARAIAISPKLLLADEPTAELDTKTAIKIIQAFHTLVKEKDMTIIMTTHDPTVLELIEHIYTLEDKKIHYEQKEINI